MILHGRATGKPHFATADTLIENLFALCLSNWSFEK